MDGRREQTLALAIRVLRIGSRRSGYEGEGSQAQRLLLYPVKHRIQITLHAAFFARFESQYDKLAVGTIWKRNTCTAQRALLVALHRLRAAMMF